MGMMYSANFGAVAVTAAQDVFEIVAPSDCIVVIHEIAIEQSSDAGDAQAELLRIQAIKGYTVSGSGGSSVTPTKMETGFPASGVTVEANNTTVANTGSPVTLFDRAFNVQIGFFWQPTPECRIVLSPSERLVVRIPAPADSLTMQGTVIFEEVGGS
jgi:hypothetical protein